MFNKATDKEDYERIPELYGRNIANNIRGKGTVQAATWKFTQFSKNARLRNQRLFVVVTRNDHPWGEPHSKTNEKYSLAVCFRDRTNQNARLYSQVRTLLRARERTRVRVY